MASDLNRAIHRRQVPQILPIHTQIDSLNDCLGRVFGPISRRPLIVPELHDSQFTGSAFPLPILVPLIPSSYNLCKWPSLFPSAQSAGTRRAAVAHDLKFNRAVVAVSGQRQFSSNRVHVNKGNNMIDNNKWQLNLKRIYNYGCPTGVLFGTSGFPVTRRIILLWHRKRREWVRCINDRSRFYKWRSIHPLSYELLFRCIAIELAVLLIFFYTIPSPVLSDECAM